MRRREFITLLGGAAASPAMPFGLHAQTSTPVVGFLRVTSAADSAHLTKAFREGLKESAIEARTLPSPASPKATVIACRLWPGI